MNIITYTCHANLKRKKLVFRKVPKGAEKFVFPDKLRQASLPVKARYELQQFFNYIQ